MGAEKNEGIETKRREIKRRAQTTIKGKSARDCGVFAVLVGERSGRGPEATCLNEHSSGGSADDSAGALCISMFSVCVSAFLGDFIFIWCVCFCLIPIRFKSLNSRQDISPCQMSGQGKTTF